jgi:ADP-ribosylglycohydrolase
LYFFAYAAKVRFQTLAVRGTDMVHSKSSNILLGALVADAACLGLHWIYDPDQIKKITTRQGGRCAFTSVDLGNYEGVKGYFAHAGRSQGMMTQYGETLRLTIQSMNAKGGAFDVAAYQKAFEKYFGPGGAYKGYIDRVTRGTLDNIAKDKLPTGIDDDQNPAITRLPAIVARYHGDPLMPEMLVQSMQVTNVNDVAGAYSNVFSDVLARVIGDEPLGAALEAAVESADDLVKDDLKLALSASDTNATDFAGLMGRACHLPTAGPVMFYILKNSGSYREAVEHNILAGGDSAGRAILLGAIMAGVHGVGTATGIPISWLLQLDDGHRIWMECEVFSEQ